MLHFELSSKPRYIICFLSYKNGEPAIDKSSYLNNFSLKWLYEYNGPNPYSSSAVVVGELSGDRKLDTSQVKEACSELWTQSEIVPTTDFESTKVNEDLLLILGENASAWTQAALNEVHGFILHSGAQREGNAIRLWVGFHNAQLSRVALQLAMQSLTQLLIGASPSISLKAQLDKLYTLCRKYHPGKSARILMSAARTLGVPYRPFLMGTHYLQFGEGRYAKTFLEASNDGDSSIGTRIQHDKPLSKAFIKQIGAPVARHVLISDENELEKHVQAIGYPCVIKPVDGMQARGVTVNVRDLFALKKAYITAQAVSSKPVMLEQHIEGNVYRLLVVRGQFLAATMRLPAYVEGDGSSSVLELAKQLNRARQSTTHGIAHGICPLDSEFDASLANQNLQRGDVPTKGQRVKLRMIPLLDTGSTNYDVTDHVHVDTRFIVEAIAQSLRLDTVGFDIISPDIGRSIQVSGAFLEINYHPSLRGHLVNGQDIRGIARAILGEGPRRLPALLIICTTKQALTILEQAQQEANLGWRLTRDHVGIGSTPINLQGADLMHAIQALVINRKVERLIIACQAEDLILNGLPLEYFDRIVITAPNISETLISWLKRYTSEFINEPRNDDQKAISLKGELEAINKVSRCN